MLAAADSDSTCRVAARAERQHLHAQLVPQDARIAEERLLALKGVQIGAADPYLSDLDAHFPGPGYRCGHLPDSELLRCVVDDCLHADSHDPSRDGCPCAALLPITAGAGVRARRCHSQPGATA